MGGTPSSQSSSGDSAGTRRRLRRASTGSRSGRAIAVYIRIAARNTHGIKVETGDFDGDLRSDVLVFADQDGSGGCGVYRALVTAPGSIRQVYSRQLCEDQGSIHLEGAGLVIRIGEAKDPKTANEIHCCFRFLRTTVKRWNGHELVVVRSYRRQLKRAQPWPPGGYPPG